MTTFTFERATVNNVSGWIAVCRIDGLYAGKQFGRTKSEAKESFNG